MLRGVADGHRASIEELQPYTGLHIHRNVKIALRSLAHLSNTDKHRYLHPAIGVLDPLERTLAHVESTHRILEHRVGGGLLHDGAEVLAVRTSASPEAGVRMQGRIAHDVAFGEPWATLNALDGMHEQVRGIVESFASAFE